MSYKHIHLPQGASPILYDETGKPQVPDHPIILFIEGDGIGVDITPVMRRVVDAAVKKAYGQQRRVGWTEIYAGEKATQVYGSETGLPEETLSALRTYYVGIKGPLTTPVGGGIRSLNVALRQKLDLYVCQRPVRYYAGGPSPVKEPEKTDMVIFRENSEDIYAGIEWAAQTPEAKKVIRFLIDEMGVEQIRFPDSAGIGIKPVSQAGTARLVRKALSYAVSQKKDSVTLVHKGNIMKYTEGAFRDWGYAIAREEYGARLLDGGPWMCFDSPLDGRPIIVKDVIADAFLQQILLRPQAYSVIATLNLNGDYLSDALAAQVGGIGIAPGANFGDKIALFEATHGTAPTHAGQDKVNPGSLILSAEMMLRYLGWDEAAAYLVKGVSGAILSGQVTYDFARLMDNTQPVTCSQFGEAVVQHMA